MSLRDRAKNLTMRVIRFALRRVNESVDLSKLRKQYNKNTLRLFAVNVTDLDYSAVIDATGDKLQLVGEGPVSEYEDIPEINLVVNLDSVTLFDIVENNIDPMKAYLLGRISVLKANENTFAADMKIVNEVFYYMTGVLNK